MSMNTVVIPIRVMFGDGEKCCYTDQYMKWCSLEK